MGTHGGEEPDALSLLVDEGAGMSDRLRGKVAFITGAARGQGRSHAVHLAREGADIVAIDICQQISTVTPPLGNKEDLAETVAQVEALGRRIVAREADVRDFAAIEAAVADGEAALGGINIVLANAGIAPVGGPEPDHVETFRDVIDVNLIGTWNTIRATAPGMIERARGGAMVLTSSTQGLTGRGGDGTAAVTGYAASKHGVVGLMHSVANWLAPHSIRVNSVHPTGVYTPMIINDVVSAYAANNPSGEAMSKNAMPVDLVEASDISNAVLYLVSDEGRYVTGVALPVDAGFMVR